MSPTFTAEEIYQLTIEKAIREDKHPMEIFEEVKKLIELKRMMESQRIKQALSGKGSVN